MPAGGPHGLIERDRACLLVIDVQQYFLNKLPLDWRTPLVSRIAWLMRVARLLDIPILATAEDATHVGPLVRELADEMPAGMPVHTKMVFGLADQPDLRAAVEGTGRRDLVLTGLETDVCVAHSAIGLMEAGYRVAVITDATASPPPHHDLGLARIAAAGAIVTDVKGVYYEWVRDVPTHSRIRAQLNASLPPGLTL
jgi:nicotinamidase-related amidase